MSNTLVGLKPSFPWRWAPFMLNTCPRRLLMVLFMMRRTHSATVLPPLSPRYTTWGMK